MFTIIGITGRVGGSTAETLLAAGKKVRGIVRDKARAAYWAKQGVELLYGNLDDIATLTEACRGSEGVFVMVPPYFAPAPGYPETRSIVANIRSALVAAKPKKVVCLSSVGAQRQHGLGLITQSQILEQEMRALPFPSAAIRASSSRKEISRSLAMPASSSTRTWRKPPLTICSAARSSGQSGAA